MKGASAPTSTITPSRTSAIREERRRKSVRTVRPSGDSRGRAALMTAESGVGPGIEQVGEQTAKSDHDAADDHPTDDEGVVARADGVHHRVSHSWPGEDALDEKRSGEKRGEGEPDQRDNRQQCIAQRMASQDFFLRQTFQSRGTD